jgi:hypothetical protein
MRRNRYVGWLMLAVLALSACGQQQPAGPPSGPSEPLESPLEDFGAKPQPEAVPSDAPTDAPTTAPPTQDPKVPTAPANEDCVSYNAANLTVTAHGDAWILRDGSHSMKLFDTKADAEDGKKVARNWSRLCFIGRNNTRAERSRFIFTYFRMPSGLPLGPAPTFECIAYDKTKLTIYSGAAHPALPGETTWALHSGATPLLFFASEPDALRGKLVAAENKQLCLIGHGNSRPDPSRYILEYWRP